MPAAKDTLDFLVIGAQKAGTTTLFQNLRRHPQIALPGDKELPFFSREAVYTRGLSAYMESLARTGALSDPAHKWGTVTPQYMAGGVVLSSRDDAESLGYDERTVPTRIRESMPDVRLVAILRDPVERARSHHQMLVRRGAERRSFDDAIDELLQPQALEHARRNARDDTGYVVRGEYGRILGGYFDVFDAEQLLVVFTAELARDPGQLLSRIQAFIGVDPDFRADTLGGRYLASRSVRVFSWRSPSSWITPTSPVSPQGVRRALARTGAAQALWHALPDEGRRRVMGSYQRSAAMVARWNRRASPNEGSANAQPRPATLERLRAHYAPDSARLDALLGAAPPWPVANGALAGSEREPSSSP